MDARKETITFLEAMRRIASGESSEAEAKREFLAYLAIGKENIFSVENALIAMACIRRMHPTGHEELLRLYLRDHTPEQLKAITKAQGELWAVTEHQRRKKLQCQETNNDTNSHDPRRNRRIRRASNLRGRV